MDSMRDIINNVLDDHGWDPFKQEDGMDGPDTPVVNDLMRALATPEGVQATLSQLLHTLETMRGDRGLSDETRGYVTDTAGFVLKAADGIRLFRARGQREKETIANWNDRALAGEIVPLEVLTHHLEESLDSVPFDDDQGRDIARRLHRQFDIVVKPDDEREALRVEREIGHEW